MRHYANRHMCVRVCVCTVHTHTQQVNSIEIQSMFALGAGKGPGGEGHTPSTAGRTLWVSYKCRTQCVGVVKHCPIATVKYPVNNQVTCEE